MQIILVTRAGNKIRAPTEGSKVVDAAIDGGWNIIREDETLTADQITHGTASIAIIYIYTV